jgi:hypothetical protein
VKDVLDIQTSIPGVKGHTRSTWRDTTHLRGVLLKLVTQHPDASRDELEAMYLAKVRKVSALVDEALRRAFDNDLSGIQRLLGKRRQPASQNVVAAAAERLATVVLLDLMMPNGKRLRDSTGKECRQTGGWLIKVADRVGDRGVVGAKLSEAEVAKILTS